MFSRTTEEMDAHREAIKNTPHGGVLNSIIKVLAESNHPLDAGGELECVYDMINTYGAELKIGDVEVDIKVKAPLH